MCHLILSVFFFIGSNLECALSILSVPLWLMFAFVYEQRTNHKGFIKKFRDGLVWGVLAFGFHTSWLLIMLYDHGCGMHGVMLWLVTVGWFALISGLWFVGMGYGRVIATLIFFAVMTHASLWPCGSMQGYPFFNPLLACAPYSSLLWPVHVMGDVGAWLWLIVFSWLLSHWYEHRQKRYAIAASMLLLIFVCGVLIDQHMGEQRKTEEQQKKEGACMRCIRPWWYGCGDAMFAGYRMAHALSKLVVREQCEVIIFPESTFCWDAFEYQNFWSIWCDGLDGILLIVGTHRYAQGRYQNCVLVLQDGKIVQVYDKQHLMPLVETSGGILDWLGCGTMFAGKQQVACNEIGEYGACKHCDCDVVSIAGQQYQLWVCSELFFETKRIKYTDAGKKMPMLFLWNDTWFACAWMRRRAQLFIKYFEKKYGVIILHVSTLGVNNIE